MASPAASPARRRCRKLTLGSSSFNVSSTNITTDNSSNSMTSTVLAPSGMFTLTMTETTNSTFTGRRHDVDDRLANETRRV